MCGELESGTCDVCKKTDVILTRKYYHYRSIKCECHSPNHFELVRHCADCTPKPPETTKVVIGLDNITDVHGSVLAAIEQPKKEKRDA